MTLASKSAADQFAKDRGEAVDEIVKQTFGGQREMTVTKEVEAMARAAWNENPPTCRPGGTGNVVSSWVLWDDDDMHESDRRIFRAKIAAALSALERNIGDGMVERARIALIPTLDECHMDDDRERCLAEIKAGLSAAIRAARRE